MVDVSIIIPNLNGEDLLPDCLDSLNNLIFERGKVEIILVDNASSDNSVDFVRENYPGVKILENEENLGFAQGCNTGAEIASGEYLVFLNNDTKVDENWLGGLFSEIDPENNVVCTSSKILSWKGEEIEFGGGALNFCGFGFQKSDWKERYQPLDKPHSLPFACGCSMLIKKDVFMKSGMFDSDFFAFYEDVDLGWRLNLMDYEIRFAPRSVVYHRYHQTAGKLEEGFRYYLWTKNTLASLIKNYEEDNLKKIFPIALVLTVERMNYFFRKAGETDKIEIKDESEMYIKNGIQTARAVEWIFENIEKIVEKRKNIQKNRVVDDLTLADKFDLKLDFDDIINEEPECIRAPSLLDLFDLSDLFEDSSIRNYIRERMNKLKDKYISTSNDYLNLQEDHNNLKNQHSKLEHRVKHLEGRKAELEQYNEALKSEIEEIKHSKTFRVLEFVKKIARILKMEN